MALAGPADLLLAGAASAFLVLPVPFSALDLLLRKVRFINGVLALLNLLPRLPLDGRRALRAVLVKRLPVGTGRPTTTIVAASPTLVLGPGLVTITTKNMVNGAPVIESVLTLLFIVLPMLGAIGHVVIACTAGTPESVDRGPPPSVLHLRDRDAGPGRTIAKTSARAARAEPATSPLV